jgi:hypothetical protein
MINANDTLQTNEVQTAATRQEQFPTESILLCSNSPLDLS